MNKIDELFSIFAQTAHIYHQWSRQNQIQYAELAVLYMLMRYQPCSQKHICQAWLLPKQTVSTVCKQFHAQGWLQFTPSAHDKREKIMTLTPCWSRPRPAIDYPINTSRAASLTTIWQRTHRTFTH